MEKNNGVACSRSIARYFHQLESEADECYNIAEKARRQGRDPELFVEIPKAKDLASRVEGLLEIQGIAERIRELSRQYDREGVSIQLAKEVAKNAKGSKQQALDNAIRAGLAVLTEGILVAPLEGVADVKVHGRGKSSYASIYYAGPIRSAGGTGQAMSVLIADLVRRELGIGRYIPTQKEIERYKEEISLYKRMQYTPTNEEIELIIKNCPICIHGEGTEEEEISGNRDLPRVETNRVRGGACLVLGEGLCLKASKIQKHVRRLKIDGWEFINTLAKGKKKGDDSEDKTLIEPSDKFAKDIVAGRPVLCDSSKKGGFRLRYGRGRATGLAAVSIHPATMTILDDFIAIGTQIKLERPGKAGAVTPCDSIEGPIVLLNNGDLVEVKSMSEALTLRKDIKRIVDLGEILIPYGEFLENNHRLMPGAFCSEWWLGELESKVEDEESIQHLIENMSAKKAFDISEEFGVPLHPDYNLFWHDIVVEDYKKLRKHVLQGQLEDGLLEIGNDEDIKRILIALGALHKVRDNKILVGKHAYPLLRCLGLKSSSSSIEEEKSLKDLDEVKSKDTLSWVSKAAGVTVRARSPTRIGARMGRPEKAKERKMKPAPHLLFPLGEGGGSQRLVNEALKHGKIQGGRSGKQHLANGVEKRGIIEVQCSIRECTSCRKRGVLPKCECGGHTEIVRPPTLQRLDLEAIFKDAMSKLSEYRVPTIKGVKGMTSKAKTPEALEKGILRAKHEVFVFKDGTTRFDMTDVPLTHVRLDEIGIDVEKAKELGYEHDHLGEPLTNTEQTIEMMPQDIIPSKRCGEYLLKVSKFIDEQLEKMYDLKPVYNAKAPQDLIGHLVMGLAPHTSGGVLARIIGYNPAKVGYAHPYFHAAKRRNCDGDEDCVILLLDGLLNFSKYYLPESRGGRMDAPLVLTTRINPDEIDKEAHNLDVGSRYPLEFYKACMSYEHPKDIEEIMDVVANRIGKASQYEGFGYTHDTASIGEGPGQSRYKTLGTMIEKMEGQLALAAKIQAVDTDMVVSGVIGNHFLRDLTGNLRKFSTQKVRCTKCNMKFRRIPIAGMGKCTRCGGNLTLTVHEGSVKKYLCVTKNVSENYDISLYTQQRVLLVENAINSLFDNDRVKDCTLEDFL